MATILRGSMEFKTQQSYYLQPGFIYCTQEPVTLNAVVGSSVAVCLWDQDLHYGAMCHYVAPRAPDPSQATPRYGNVATRESIRMLEALGSNRSRLVAQIIGGAYRGPEGDTGMGERNVGVAVDLLLRLDIHIQSKDTGGELGRKIAFNTGNGHVLVLKVHRIREDDWRTEDRTPAD